MLNLKKIFDAEKDIVPFIEEYSFSSDDCHEKLSDGTGTTATATEDPTGWPTNGNDTATVGGGAFMSVSGSESMTTQEEDSTFLKDETKRLKIRIVGQEQDGALLYTWDAKVPSSSNSEGNNGKVTHIGLYDPIKKTNEVVFVHEKLVDIVSCTISQEQTFLGFVTLEQTYISESLGRKQKQDIYHAYLAEIASPSLASRVFYLNLERSQLITLQFLYGQYRGHVMRRESHLLVLLHKESIGLYHIPVARVGNDGVIMSGEPKKDQIFEKRFIWSQWDSQHQRLIVACLKKPGKSSHGSGNIAGSNCLLSCYQFTEDTVNELMVDIPIELPAPFGKSSGSKVHYLSHGPYQSTPDSTLNMQLLMQNNGSVCVCVQHPYISTKTAKGTPPTLAANAEKSENIPIQYSVHMVHHGKTLKCFGMTVPRTVARKVRLLFTWLGDYLMVHAHGYFTHLLNVGIEFQPCHHILWHDVTLGSPCSPPGTKPPAPALMLPLIMERPGCSSTAATSMYDLESQVGYKVTLDNTSLLRLFETTVNSTTRIAILHLATVHQKDLTFIKKIFKALKNDVVSAEVTGLIDEYLVGSTYSSMKKLLDPHVYKYIPFTCAAMFRGQTEMALTGERLSSISYTSLSPVVLGSQSKHRSTRAIYEPWNHFADFAKSETTLCRFSSLEVLRLIRSDDDDDTFVKVKSPETPSILQRLTSIAKSALTPMALVEKAVASPKPEARHPSRSELILGSIPKFLIDSSIVVDPSEEQLVSVTVDLFSAHLMNYMKKDSRAKTKSIASEYVACQIQQSRQVIHLICAVLLTDDISETSLIQTPNKDEHALFLLLERYKLATEEQAFPIPPGFTDYFSCLGYRCLQSHVFRQYVDNKVFHISKEFCLKMLRDIPDSVENVDMKYFVLHQLEPEDSLYCARQWKHPLSRRFLALHYTEACLTDGPKEDFAPLYDEDELKGDSWLDSPTGFPPLSTLNSLMEKKSWRQSRGLKAGSPDVDTRLLNQTSLRQFYASGGRPSDILTFG